MAKKQKRVHLKWDQCQSVPNETFLDMTQATVAATHTEDSNDGAKEESEDAVAEDSSEGIEKDTTEDLNENADSRLREGERTS
jgi:hypothetical protein